ncbi:hypothetical protein GLYMA_16G136466v4 [Glycine max]|nr:hypothetical protein GLYMA_16G136466v4 [Glycine max]
MLFLVPRMGWSIVQAEMDLQVSTTKKAVQPEKGLNNASLNGMHKELMRLPRMIDIKKCCRMIELTQGCYDMTCWLTKQKVLSKGTCRQVDEDCKLNHGYMITLMFSGTQIS